MHPDKKQLRGRTFFYEKQPGPPRFGAPEKTAPDLFKRSGAAGKDQNLYSTTSSRTALGSAGGALGASAGWAGVS